MLDEIKEIKLKKLENLRKAGVDPYPEKTGRTMENKEAVDKFDESQNKVIVLVGRVKSLRPMGGSAFAHIEDESGKMQVFLSKKNIDPEKYKLFIDTMEIGDFVEVKGKLFKTKTEEITLEVSDWKILSKSLVPVPTEYFGVKDTEELLRRRYLDLMMNPETRELFRKKNIFWQTARTFLAKHGFLEVQTPVLENIPGGAEAQPFVTHHNALDRDYFMRISLELPLKRLLVGGYEKVFEIGRLFRNEGIDREHLQEYDDLEFYEAYSDLERGVNLVEAMYKEIVKEVSGKMETEYEGNIINWGNKWETKDYFSLFKQETGIDLDKEISASDLKKKADELGIKYEKNYGKGRMIDTIYKKTVRPKLIQPCFLVGHPIEISPLAKKDPKDPRKVLRMQVLVAGSELGNGFAELNDPVDQRERFEQQMKLREAGDEEAQMLDEDFVEALEYGMPPAFGFGFSERLFSLLMNKSVRETVIFPPMKEATNKEGKSKKTKIAVAIINKNAGMEPWQELNTIAHLNASFAAREGKGLFYQDDISTEDNEKIKLNIQHAILIKSAHSSREIFFFFLTTKRKKLGVVEFTKEMIDTTDDKKVIEITGKKKASDIEYLGALIFGDKSLVETITRKFDLYK
ncbi:MAG: lysine--tRNA ligase [Candidatus Moranbacteria bacterium]|nr:lysine--tRNA ligase [Candidatus Moranbacteria bacterium]